MVLLSALLLVKPPPPSDQQLGQFSVKSVAFSLL